MTVFMSKSSGCSLRTKTLIHSGIEQVVVFISESFTQPIGSKTLVDSQNRFMSESKTQVHSGMKTCDCPYK